MSDILAGTDTGEVPEGTNDPKPSPSALAIAAQQKGRGWRFGASGLTYTLVWELTPSNDPRDVARALRGGASLWWKPEMADRPVLVTAGATGKGYSIKDDADDYEHHVLTIAVPQNDLVNGVAVMDGPAKSSENGPAGMLYIENNQTEMGF